MTFSINLLSKEKIEIGLKFTGRDFELFNVLAVPKPFG